MVDRNLSCSALTLRVRASGESNREAWFLSAEEGLIRATVFGGPKSRLRSRVAPYHQGVLYLYQDPVRESRKVQDFDVQSYRTGIRELYERLQTASALAETILSSHGGGGNWQGALELGSSVLDALERAEKEACTALGVYFMWHWAQILGLRPDISVCGGCSAPSGSLKDRRAPLWYSLQRETLYCEGCRQKLRSITDSTQWLPLDQGALTWLLDIEGQEAQALLQGPSPPLPSLERARGLASAVLALSLGKRLPSWEGI